MARSPSCPRRHGPRSSAIPARAERACVHVSAGPNSSWTGDRREPVGGGSQTVLARNLCTAIPRAAPTGVFRGHRETTSSSQQRPSGNAVFSRTADRLNRELNGSTEDFVVAPGVAPVLASRRGEEVPHEYKTRLDSPRRAVEEQRRMLESIAGMTFRCLNLDSEQPR